MTPQEIRDRIQAELTQVMGPLAPVILDEKAGEFGMSMENLSAGKMPELVEEASFEIQNHRKKVQFQRAALKILRELPRQPVVPEKVKTPEPPRDGPNPVRRKPRLRLAEDPRTRRQKDSVGRERKQGPRLAQEQQREGKM
jgi:hypothetical protein